MSNFIVVPLSSEYAAGIRAAAQDHFGHPIENKPASAMGYGPCRCCLRQTQPGENRLLFSYAPVRGNTAYDEVGPVFIHAHDCQTYDDTGVFPPEVRQGRLPIPLVLRAYSAERRMIDALPVPDNNRVEDQIAQLFDNPAVSFIHVRNAQAQCFICELRRA